jgi:hypothetical protein
VVVLKKAVVLMLLCYLGSTFTDTFLIIASLEPGLKDLLFPSLQATSIEPNMGRKPNVTHAIDSAISIQ